MQPSGHSPLSDAGLTPAWIIWAPMTVHGCLLLNELDFLSSLTHSVWPCPVLAHKTTPSYPQLSPQKQLQPSHQSCYCGVCFTSYIEKAWMGQWRVVFDFVLVVWFMDFCLYLIKWVQINICRENKLLLDGAGRHIWTGSSDRCFTCGISFGRAEDLFSFWEQRGQPGPSSFPDHIANCVYSKLYLFTSFRCKQEKIEV